MNKAILETFRITFVTFTCLAVAFILSGCHDSDKALPGATPEANIGTASIPNVGVNQRQPGPKPASFYANTTSNLTFEQISKRVTGVQPFKNSKDEVLAYIFFDPLCPHCANEVKLLLAPDAAIVAGKVVWVPVGFLKEFSTLQGATILSSSNPEDTFMQHEARVLQGDGKEYALNVKMAKQVDIDKVVENTRVWREAGANQVPFIVTRDTSGKTLAAYGEFEGFIMGEFLSLPPQS